MNNFLTFFSLLVCISMFFYPSNTNSNTTGSPGGKTGSPIDGQTCTQCHGGNVITNINNTAILTTNIPNSGYVIGNTYTITLTANGGSSINKYGFELTAESNSVKSGDFFITDNTTKLVNANSAVTHKASGTNGGVLKQWSVDWTPTNSSNDSTILYAAIMLADGNGDNDSNDQIYLTNLSVFENQITSISEASNNEFVFNTLNKSIISNQPIIVYDLNGRIILESNEEVSDLSNLKSGMYIIKSLNTSQKMILN